HPPGVEIEGPDGKRYVVVDNFAKRTAFKTCAIDQFELKEFGPKRPRVDTQPVADTRHQFPAQGRLGRHACVRLWLDRW
ncbi:MAG: hypothetical protein INR62_04875, partial [Rhodospirillales bacterium]|nr:hypothetical protein [Acetobacter sp.]